MHPASDDAVLLEHLQLANQQLRAVLADAGCSLPELPLPADLQQQLQEEEAMPLLAEENYQLRQLLQQLQHQQQLQELEQQLALQQELELNRSALEFDRLDLTPELSAEIQGGSPPPPSAAAPAEHESARMAPVGSSPAAAAAAAVDRAAWASPAQAGSVVSPAAARLVAVPSLNTVQLVEAEAAAQLATQAVIQAEAEAYQHMSWQLQNNRLLQDPSGLTHSTVHSAGLGAAPSYNEQPTGGLTYSHDQQQQQFEDHIIHPQRLFVEEQHATQPAVNSLWRQQQEGQQQEQGQLALSCGDGGRSARLGLPQLPRLALPRPVTGRRSLESTCSDAARSCVSQPPSASAAASARLTASGSCGRLKQLTSDLLLLPPAVRPSAAATGPDALRETFGDAAVCADYENGARGFGVGHACAAAGLAADAAAGIWYPAAAAAAADGSSSSAQLAARGEGAVGGLASPSTRAAGVAADAVRSIMYPGAQGSDQAAAAAQQQQQQQAGASAGAGAAQPSAASAIAKGGLRLPLSVFAGATDAAHAAAAGLEDLFIPDQYQRQRPAATPNHQPQQQPQQPQQPQQQQSPQLAAGSGLHMQMPALPPIATRHGGSRPPAHSNAAAVSQAAAAAAALAGHGFHMQLPPQPQQQQQPSQQQLPALRLPPRVQTFQQQQQQQQQQQEQERRSSSFDSTMSDIPPSLPKLRMPAPRQTSAPPAAASVEPAASLPRLQTQAGSGSYSSGSSSPGESPVSASAFFRAGADPGLFDGGSNGMFDSGADMFGARISMDDSGYHFSTSEAQPSQLPDVPEDYFGLPDSTGSGEDRQGDGSSYGGASQQSGWLGVSYQQQSLRDGRLSGWSSAQGSRELFQPLAAAAASAESYGAAGRHRRRSLAADTIYELSELQLQEQQEEPLSRQATWSGSGGFVATAAGGSFSSLTSGALSQQVSFQGGGISTQPSAVAGGAGAAAAAYRSGHQAQQQGQQQEQLPAFPNLTPLRVMTGRQQDDQTPPLTWQPRPLLRVDGVSSSTARSSNLARLPAGSAAAAVVAATSPAHMAATEAAEEAASVGLAAAATGGMDSLQLQQLLHHLARVAEEASSTAASAAFVPITSRTLSAPAGPPAIRTGRVEPQSNGSTPAAARHAAQHTQHQHEQPLQGGQQQDSVTDPSDCCTPVSRGSGGNQAGAAGLPSGPSSRSLSPFAAAAAAAAAAVSSPARAGAAGGCLVLSPQPSSLQRTLSAGQMGPGAALGLPPKWASRSGSSSNLTALHSQQLASPRRQQQHPLGADDTAGHSHADLQQQHAAARAVPDRAAAVPASAPPVSLISPRLGLHGGLRVITHAAGAQGGGGAYSSNGSVSDADAGSAHTTPMHRPPQGAAAVPRTNSSSSLRPAGLASITVPPSPASSGVRYVPASPRVVGFDCPLTPHAYALRSPSWRSEPGGVEGSSVGAHNGWACGSGSSTPRRQASSPGLLQQALSRSGLGGQAPQQHYSQQQFFGQSGAASAGGSGCNTPSSAASAARRAGQQPFAAPGHAPPVAAGLAVGSHSSPGQMLQKQAGSCSSNALLVTMMGGQLSVLSHHQRTPSYPYLDVLQSPGSARRFRGSSASGLDAAAAAAAAGEDAAHAARASAAAAAAAVPPAAQEPAGHSSSSNASSRPSSTDSGAGCSHEQSAGAGTAVGTADDGSTAAPAEAAAPNAQPDAAVAGPEMALELPRSVSPQLQVSTCSSQPVSPPLLQQVTSPPAHSAQACTEAGQHRLSRFGLAAARASTEKPLPGICCKGTDEGMLSRAPEQGLTAVVMTAGMCEAAAGAGSCAGPSSSSSSQAQQQPAAPAAAEGQGQQQHVVAVPDTPALEAASGSMAFAAQQSLEQELPAVEIEGLSAAALIEQELQRALAEEAAAVSVCAALAPAAVVSSCPVAASREAAVSSGYSSSSGPYMGGGPSSSGAAGASSSRQGQHVSWSADTAACPEGGCEHHGPPASPCTPQQEAEQQQQQQQLQSPDQQAQHDWQQHQQAAASKDCGSSSPSKDHLLPRSKSAAACLSTAAAGSAADAALGASETGTPTADSTAGAGVGSGGMWSPTHDVRGASCRHMRRSPSALLMRLSQKQVDVLAARGRASTAVQYVLPHRSSNPASALRALVSGSTDCSSSGHGATPVGGTPRTSLELGRSSSTPHAQQAALQSDSSWRMEQVQPPENLLAVASFAGAPCDVYIPLPPAADAAAGEAQPQQQQAAPAGIVADAEAAGSADNREVLLSAAIVQQRLKSTSKWLSGPAPVAATAAVAEAEAAAVVTRRRSGQDAAGSAPGSQSPNSSGANRAGSGTRVASTAAALAAAAHADMVEGGLHRASSSGGGRVAMAAAALSAAAEGPREQAGVRRAGSSGSSRVAQAAAALAASGAGVAAAPALTPVRPARLKQGDAWLADGGRGAAGDAAGSVSEPAVGAVSDTLPASHSSSQGSVPVQQKEAQQRAQLPQKPASCTVQAEAAAGCTQHEQSSSDNADVGAAAGAPQQHAVVAASVGPVGAAPAVQAAAAEALAASANQDSTTGSVPAAVTADHSVPAAATDSVGGPLQAASGSAAHQLLQLDGCNDAALSAVRNRQQQLLKQRQLMRQQQQHRKRQEVAAWAAAQRQQHAGTASLAAAEGAAVSQDVASGSSGGPDQASSDAWPDAAASGAVVCDEPGLPASLADVSAVDDLSQQAVLAADAEFAAAAAAEAGDVLGHRTLGLLQRCDSLALSVADEFEVQSWAAWSTTSSINKCPKLQWWGNESSQGRFSQRQQRRMQQQGAGAGSGGGAAQQQRWWQRLLAAGQDGSQASRAGAGGAAGPARL